LLGEQASCFVDLNAPIAAEGIILSMFTSNEQWDALSRITLIHRFAHVQYYYISMCDAMGLKRVHRYLCIIHWTGKVELAPVGEICLTTFRLTTHSLNSGKPLDTDCCEWLWSIAMWANSTLPNSLFRSRNSGVNKIPLRPIDNIDRPHQLSLPSSIQGRNNTFKHERISELTSLSWYFAKFINTFWERPVCPHCDWLTAAGV